MFAKRRKTNNKTNHIKNIKSLMMTYRKIEKAKEKSNEKYKTIVRN